MARPSSAKINAVTPGGIKFQWLIDEYKDVITADGGTSTMLALVSWADADDFSEEVVGFTVWDGSAPTLDRHLPLAHPFRVGLWTDKCEIADLGAYESRDDFNDPTNNNAPAQDWIIYRLTFVRPLHWVRSNITLATFFANLEQHRFCKVTEMPRSRERRVSGMGYEFDRSAAQDWSARSTVPDEVNFIPDWQYDITTSLVNWPIEAVPHDAIFDCMNTVNATPVQLVSGGKVWPPGWLLFKGPSEPLAMHFGATLEAQFSLGYRFTVQPGGWNKYLTRDATGKRVYRNVRIRQPDGYIGPNQLPYPSKEFQRLFVPGAGAEPDIVPGP